MSEEIYCCDKFKRLIECCYRSSDLRDIARGVWISKSGQVIPVFWCDGNRFNDIDEGVNLPNDFELCPYCGERLAVSTD